MNNQQQQQGFNRQQQQFNGNQGFNRQQQQQGFNGNQQQQFNGNQQQFNGNQQQFNGQQQQFNGNQQQFNGNQQQFNGQQQGYNRQQQQFNGQQQGFNNGQQQQQFNGQQQGFNNGQQQQQFNGNQQQQFNGQQSSSSEQPSQFKLFLSRVLNDIKDNKFTVRYVIIWACLIDFILQLLPTYYLKLVASDYARLSDFKSTIMPILAIAAIICYRNYLSDKFSEKFLHAAVLCFTLYTMYLLIHRILYAFHLGRGYFITRPTIAFWLLMIVMIGIIAMEVLVLLGLVSYDQDARHIHFTKMEMAKAADNAVVHMKKQAKQAANGMNDLMEYGNNCNDKHAENVRQSQNQQQQEQGQQEQGQQDFNNMQQNQGQGFGGSQQMNSNDLDFSLDDDIFNTKG